jgi:hypothetical protein
MIDNNNPTNVPVVCRAGHANGNLSAAWRSSDNLRLSTLRRTDWPKADRPDDEPPPQAA